MDGDGDVVESPQPKKIVVNGSGGPTLPQGIGRLAMRPVLIKLTACIIFVCSLGACRKDEARTAEIRGNVHVQLISDSGEIREEALTQENDYRVEELGRLFPHASGKFIARLSMSVGDTAGALEISGRLSSGLVVGKVVNRLVGASSNVLVAEVTYRDNIRDGPARSYYADSGEVQFDFAFRDGLRSGRLVAYYPSGQVMAKASYDQGVIDGACDTFDMAGKVETSGRYEKGREVQGAFVEDFERFIANAPVRRPMGVRIRDIASQGGVRIRQISINEVNK